MPRRSLFITSKISPYQQGYGKAKQAFDDILLRLRTDHVDLMLIHWPGVAKTRLDSPLNAALRHETWQLLEDYYSQGKARAIGVSNYEARHLQELLQARRVCPAVNQVEVHPLRQCRQLRQACQEAGVQVVAYASLGCGDLLTHPVVQQVALESGKSPAQVIFFYFLTLTLLLNATALVP